MVCKLNITLSALKCIMLLHAEYISLLFTDLGVLTPAAVSDELIQLMA